MPARFPRRPSLTLIGAVALVIAIASPAAAPPGDLDPTFDGDGKVTTDFSGSLGSDGAEAVAIQGDGKIVAAGVRFVLVGPSFSFEFALARYNTDGSLDPTFGFSGGTVTTDFDGDSDQAFAVAIQGDGKIVAAGFATLFGSSSDFGLARYNTDGSLDPTFDGDGLVTTDFANADEARGVAIQGDGKIVAAGVAGLEGVTDFAVARYNTDGSLDPTFDGDGKVTTDFSGGFDEASAVAIQMDGRIVAAGESSATGVSDFALARYNADGSLDPTFGTGGKVTTDFVGDSDHAFAVAIQMDGRIVAAGDAVASGNGDFGLVRYNTDGSVDPSFDGDGKVTTDFVGAGDGDEAHGVAIQGDGKIVAAGLATGLGRSFDFGLGRYNTDGSLDTVFSGDGKVTTDFAGDFDRAFAVALQGDGKIVAAGVAFVSDQNGNDFALARYTVCRRTSRPSSIPFCP